MISNPARKVRADAKLEQLDVAQRELLHFWFEENFSYYEVVRLVQEKFGLSVSKSTVAAYWKRHIMPQRQQDDAEEVAALAGLPAGDFNTAIFQRVWALAWDALARSHPDIDKAAKLLAIVRKAEQHALALKRLALEERRVALRETRLRQGFGEAEQGPAEPAKKRSMTRREPPAAAPVSLEASAVVPALCEKLNSLGRPGYSETVRPAPEPSTKEVQSRPVEISAEVGERGEGAELAAKAQSGEDLNKGREEEAGVRESCGEGESGLAGDAAFAEEMARLDAWEMELDEIGCDEAGAERLAAIAKDVYAHLIRFKNEQGLGGGTPLPSGGGLSDARPDC